MNTLFEHEWFLTELDYWFDYETSVSMALAVKYYWEFCVKPYTVMNVDLSRLTLWNKKRPSIYNENDIFAIVIQPPNLKRGLYHTGTTRKRFRKNLQDYWLPLHPNIQLIIYKHNHDIYNLPIGIDIDTFVKTTSQVMKMFNFSHIYNNNFPNIAISIWKKNDDSYHYSNHCKRIIQYGEETFLHY